MRVVETIHGPVVAGQFYPADPQQLRHQVRSLLGTTTELDVGGRLVGLIVPHAGLMYSGAVAASAFRLLIDRRFDRIVAIGPSHFTLFDGIAALPADGWRTPLGVVPVEQTALTELIRISGEPYRREHCLEVQLPFIQETLPSAVVAPLLFGEVDPQAASDALSGLLEANDLLLVSSDLSHYLPQAEANAVDSATAEAIAARRPGALSAGSACGRRPLQAALFAALRHGWDVELLDLRTSADTAGSPDRVVGYGAFAMSVGG